MKDILPVLLTLLWIVKKW